MSPRELKHSPYCRQEPVQITLIAYSYTTKYLIILVTYMTTVNKMTLFPLKVIVDRQLSHYDCGIESLSKDNDRFLEC